MTFVNLNAFWLLLALPPIVLLYFLKLRRRELLVSTTFFWARTLEDLHVNSPFQRLKKSLLLFLQIAVLLLLVLGAASPTIETRGTPSDLRIVLLDLSASMKARDVPPNRFEAARSLAEEMIETATPSSPLALIGFHRQARILAPPTSSKTLLKKALAEAEATDLGGSPREALRLAGTLEKRAGTTEIILLSDGGFDSIPIEDQLQFLEQARLRFVRIGVSGDNLGITQIASRKGFYSETGNSLLVTVENFGTEARTVSLVVEKDGSLYRSKRLELSSESVTDTVFSLDEGATGLLIAHLDDNRDVFPLDDRAYSVLAPPRSPRGLLLTEGNLFLARALNAIPHLRLASLLPGEFPKGAEDERFDLYFHDYDGPSTPELPPGGHLFFKSSPPTNEVRLKDPVPSAIVLDWDARHPVTRYADFSDLVVTEFRPLELAPTATPLLVTDQGCAIAAIRTENWSGVVTGFSLRDSNWPLQLSFPLFLANCTEWLLSQTSPPDRASYRTGDLIRPHFELNPPISVTHSQDGTTSQEKTLSPIRGAFVPEQVGVWSVTTTTPPRETLSPKTHDSAPTRTRFAVNLASPSESRVQPRAQVFLGPSPTPASKKSEIGVRRPLWKPILGIALILLLAEWAVYHRRVVL